MSQHTIYNHTLLKPFFLSLWEHLFDVISKLLLLTAGDEEENGYIIAWRPFVTASKGWIPLIGDLNAPMKSRFT